MHLTGSIQKGLLAVVLSQDTHGNLVRKAGVMGVVINGGEVRPSNKIVVQLPDEPYVALELV